MTAADPQGTLDRAAGALSRGLARKFTRRSVLSKVGKYGVGMGAKAWRCGGWAGGRAPETWRRRWLCQSVDLYKCAAL